AMRRGNAGQSVDDFYFLARSCLVKDETRFDLFDRIFRAYVDGLDAGLRSLGDGIPADWLRREAELALSDEEKARIEALGGFDRLLQALSERLEEQQERHQGGNKWIGTAGTSPFGAF